MIRRGQLRRIATLLLAAALLATSGPPAQLQDADREKWERVPDLLAALELKPGMRVSDVGAGDGFHTVRIARAVGPGGRVTAVDISEQALTKLKERVNRAGIVNVDAVLGLPADPRLDPCAYDATLVYNSYHEMAEHQSMLRQMFRALKGGGRLVMAEPIHEKNRGLSREKQVATHEISLEIVGLELAAAGFKVHRKDESFIRFTDAANPGGFWLVVTVRPRAFEAHALDYLLKPFDRERGAEPGAHTNPPRAGRRHPPAAARSVGQCAAAAAP